MRRRKRRRRAPPGLQDRLQELVQRQADQVLVYQVVGEQGPDHAKTFEAEVLLNGTPLGTGCGHSKKKPNRLRRKRIGSVGT